MSGMKIVRYDAKNSLQISGHGVDGVSQRDENNLAFFLELGRKKEVMLILKRGKGLH